MIKWLIDFLKKHHLIHDWESWPDDFKSRWISGYGYTEIRKCKRCDKTQEREI